MSTSTGKTDVESPGRFSWIYRHKSLWIFTVSLTSVAPVCASTLSRLSTQAGLVTGWGKFLAILTMRVYMIMGTVVYRTHRTWLSRLFLLCITLFMVWTVLLSLQLKSVFEVPANPGPLEQHTHILGVLREETRGGRAERGIKENSAENTRCLFRRGKTSLEKEGSSTAFNVCTEPAFASPDDKVQVNFSGVSIDFINRKILSNRTFAKIRRFNREAQSALDETRRRNLRDVIRRSKTCLQGSVDLDDYIYTPGGHWRPRNCEPRWKVRVYLFSE